MGRQPPGEGGRGGASRGHEGGGGGGVEFGAGGGGGGFSDAVDQLPLGGGGVGAASPVLDASEDQPPLLNSVESEGVGGTAGGSEEGGTGEG